MRTAERAGIVLACGSSSSCDAKAMSMNQFLVPVDDVLVDRLGSVRNAECGMRNAECGLGFYLLRVFAECGMRNDRNGYYKLFVAEIRRLRRMPA